MADDPVVGHKTSSDGQGGFRHEPLRASEAETIFAAADAAKARRAEQMPDEHAALHAMMDAYIRLKELGWNNAIYCPKDGTTFNVIEAGSSGIHTCHYDGEWPNGSWWIHDEGDFWPSRPILFKATGPKADDDSNEARIGRALARRLKATGPNTESGNG